MNETGLNQTLTNYISGSIDKNSLFTYFAQHVFLIPILMIIIFPVLVVLFARILFGKMSRDAFWTAYILGVIVAIVLGILTFVGVLPLNLAV